MAQTVDDHIAVGRSFYARPVVVVNTRQLVAGSHGGVVRYTAQVLDELGEGGVTHESLAPPAWMAGGVLGHAWEQIVLPIRLLAPARRGQTLISPANFGPLLVRNQRLTIHDVAPLDHPEWFGRVARRVFALLVPRLARRVDELVTVSEFSSSRVAATCGVDPARIQVTPPEVARCFVPAEGDTARRDVVVLAGPDPRKNLDTALAAWSSVASTLSDHRCVVVTGRRNAGVFADAAEPAGERVDTLVDPDDESLVRVLQRAAVAVFVSHYEGYGLPPLEAAACGAPVVVSDAVPSVAKRASGGGADEPQFYVVSPTDTEAVAAAIVDAIRA